LVWAKLPVALKRQDDGGGGKQATFHGEGLLEQGVDGGKTVVPTGWMMIGVFP
jgi:hypothetical protein